MNLNIYLANISELIAWVFLIYSFWKNKSDKLLVFQLISCIFFVLGYFLTGAFSGAIVVFFEMFRDYFYLKSTDDNKVFLGCLPIYLIISIFSYEGLLSLFSIFASVNDGYSLIYKGKKVVTLGIVTYVLWIIYDIYCHSYVNAFFEIILVLSNLLILVRGYTKFLNSDKLLIKRGINFNNHDIKIIDELNSSNYNNDIIWNIADIKRGMMNKLVDYIVLNDNENIVGYISFVGIKHNKYLEIINSDKLVKINYNDVLKLDKKNDNYINILFMCIDYDYQNNKTVKIFSDSIKKYLFDTYKKGYNIKGVVCTCASQLEKKILNLSQFSKGNNNSGYEVYVLSDELLEQYKKMRIEDE